MQQYCTLASKQNCQCCRRFIMNYEFRENAFDGNKLFNFYLYYVQLFAVQYGFKFFTHGSYLKFTVKL